jgi:hypothetical protein
VPTVNNTLLLSESHGWQLAAAGTGLPVRSVVSLTGAGGAFTPRPKLHGQKTVSVQQPTCEMYQKKARIAANGGDTSGSHPAWDPV